VALGKYYVWELCIHQSVLFTSAFSPLINTNRESWIKFLKIIPRLVNCWILIYILHIWSFIHREHKICVTLIICPLKRSCRALVKYFVVCAGNMFKFFFVFLNQYLRKCPKTVCAERLLISHVLENDKFFQWYIRFYSTLLHVTWVHFLPPS
jgi:hypothetical protein